MITLVTGVSGTGKTTVCRELKKRGIVTIGIDEEPHLAYWVNKHGEPFVGDEVDFNEAFLAEHDWMCDTSMLKKLIETSEKPVVICGNCENIVDCMQLCNQTVLLACDPDVFLARIEAREGNNYGKTPAAKEALLGYYQADNEKIMKAGAKMVDASQSLEAVVGEVCQYIQ